MLVTIAYTGMRWGETIGLERDLVLPTLINVEWQLREIRGRFFRIPPKDDSYRSTNWEPLVPVDTPVFLAELLTAQADKNPHRLCACAREHCGSGRYMFYSPDGGHYRRSNLARRVFRPACDGRYEAVDGRPGSLVVVDATTWPGTPAASWPPAMPGKPFTPPSGRGVPRLVSTGGTGHCSSCGRTVTLRLDGKAIIHKITDGPCPGSGQQPSEDAPLACWLPVNDGLTPHGLRHSHKTWMVEDGIPEILAEQRLGHDVPGMRGLYAHASQRMREELLTGPVGPLGAIAARARQNPSALPRSAARRPAGPIPCRPRECGRGVMTERGREELRPYLRDEPPPDDATIVIRGGPDTLAKLTMHARRTHDAYVLDGESLWGISVYCALDDVGPASLDGLLRRFASYRAVHLPRTDQLRRAGYLLLPSFGRPHFTIRLDGDDPAGLTRLLDALGPAEANKYHRRERPGRR